MVIAAGGLPDAVPALLCLTVLLLSTAGSAMLNSLFDLALDRNMTRLAGRVEALDRVTAPRLLLAALSCIALALLLALTRLNLLTFLLTLAAILLYALLYTLRLKRRSPWGAIPGGLPGALPVLIGQAAVTGAIDTGGLLLCAVVFLWQPPHFWLLALRWRDDYGTAGVPVLPVVWGERYTRFLILLYTVSLLPATLALTLFGTCSGLFALWGGLAWCFFVIASYRLAVRSRRYDRAFRASIVYLAVLLVGVIIDISR